MLRQHRHRAIALAVNEALHAMNAIEATQNLRSKQFVSKASLAILRFTASDCCQTYTAQLPFARRWASSMSYSKKTDHAARALVDRAPVVLASVDRNWVRLSLYRRFNRWFPLSEKSSVCSATARISALPAPRGSHEGLTAS